MDLEPKRYEILLDSHPDGPVGKCNLAWYPTEVIQISQSWAEWDPDDWELIAGRIALFKRAYIRLYHLLFHAKKK